VNQALPETNISDRFIKLSMNATTIFDSLADLPADFMANGRDDTPPQEREMLCERPLSGSVNSSMHHGLPIENRGDKGD